MAKSFYVFVVGFLMLFTKANAQEVDPGDTTWFRREVNGLIESLQRRDDSLIVVDGAYEADFFSNELAHWVNPVYVMNNAMLQNFLTRYKDMTDTGLVYSKTLDTVVYQNKPYSETELASVQVDGSYKCSRHYLGKVYINGNQYSDSYLYHIRQFTKYETDYYGIAYLRVDYFFAVDSTNTIIASVKYIEDNTFYDEATDLLYGFGYQFKIFEAIPMSFSSLAINTSLGNLLVYPNPSQGDMHLVWKPKQPDQKYIIDILDDMGRVIQRINTPVLFKDVDYAYQYTLQAKLSAQYYVRISDGKNKVIQKVTISK